MDRIAAPGTLQRIPVEHISATRAGSRFILFLHPFLYAMILHEPEMFNDPFMVPDAVDLVNVFKGMQALTGEIGTLKAPGHPFFLGTPPETMPAIHTGGVYLIGQATVATDFSDGNSVLLGHF